jgi:hypothetical protein
MSIVSSEPATEQREPDHRTDLIAGLRNMADWLEANPDVPVGSHDFVRLQYCAGVYIGDLTASRAEVDRVAALLDAEPYRDGTHYGAEKDFGGDVSYLALSIARKKTQKAAKA